MTERKLIEEGIASSSLSSEQISKIIQFKLFGNNNGFLLLENDCIGEIPKTPVDRESINKNNNESEKIILQATSLLGSPIGYVQESGGKLVNNLFPHKSAAKSSTSDSFDSELDLHTENAFHAILPDYLILLCLRSDPNSEAITYISSINNILNKLSEEDIQFFLKEEFNFLSDYCKKSKSCKIDINKRQTVLYGDPIQPFFRFDPAFMVASSIDAYNKLEILRNISWQVAKSVTLKKGDLLIIDNRKTAHARSRFKASLDGNDRWIQRTFASLSRNYLIEKTKKSENVFELISEL